MASKQPPSSARSRSSSAHALHVGFVPLIDAAPLIAAHELGYFADEGLNVLLARQIGWGNVRDRLSYGELHASHAPLGMAAASVAGLSYYDQPLTCLMALSAGGNAITIARSLTDLADGPNAPAAWVRHLGRPLNLAHVFSAASHYHCLREFIQQADLQIGRDVNLCVLPPQQMSDLLETGTIDGYCAGEPWNTLAESHRSGRIVRASTELLGAHPEKVLAVTQRWYTHNPHTADRLIKAVLRGCDFCENPINHPLLAKLLAQPNYIGLDEPVISKSLSIDSWLRPGNRRPRFRSFSRAATELTDSTVTRQLQSMRQWGSLPSDIDLRRIAEEITSPAAYERAIAALNQDKTSASDLVAH